MSILAQIRDLVRAREFHPFVITTDDGNARPVPQVERIGVGDKNVVLIGTDDLIEIIPGAHISSVAITSSADIDPR
ncbi:MAG: hypothetical protein JOZ31_01625 [Verrucomicrobia bacterium]|nr:hypothetical protein [Verrucomicrobiota bacterium]